MDDLLYKIFKALPNEPAPNGIHRATMRRVLFLRSYKMMAIVAAVVSASFLFSLWHLYVRLIEIDFLSTAKMIFSSFEFDVDSIIEAFHSVVDFTPVGAATLAFLNFIVLVFVLYLLNTFKRMQTLYF